MASATSRLPAQPMLLWYSLRLPTEGWPGWVDQSDR